MVVGVMEITLALYDNGSLKDKRSVIKRVVHRSRNTFNVSMAEVEDHDLTDRGTLGAVFVGNDRRVIQAKMDKLEGFIDGLGLAEVIETHKVLENY